MKPGEAREILTLRIENTGSMKYIYHTIYHLNATAPTGHHTFIGKDMLDLYHLKFLFHCFPQHFIVEIALSSYTFNGLIGQYQGTSGCNDEWSDMSPILLGLSRIMSFVASV